MSELTNKIEILRGIDMMGASFWSQRSKVFAFLSIFYPKMSLEKRLKITERVIKNA